jgi:hypothetical protein
MSVLRTRKKKRDQEGRTRYAVTPEQFALAWNESESAEEAAQRVDMPLPIVLARVSNYRKKGIKMKKMPRKDSRKLNVEKINQSVEIKNIFLVGDGRTNLVQPLVERVLVLDKETATTPKPRALSVRIHLPDGTLDGLRIAERLHSTLRAIACSKARLRQAKELPWLHKPGVYVLVGPPESEGLPKTYIGEADPAWPRLEQHIAKKPFWESIVLFSSKDDGLHKAHIQFLESRLSALARESGRCQLDNGNHPQPPTLSDADVVEAEAFLDEVRLLCPFLGLTVFEQLHTSEPTSESKNE